MFHVSPAVHAFLRQMHQIEHHQQTPDHPQTQHYQHYHCEFEPHFGRKFVSSPSFALATRTFLDVAARVTSKSILIRCEKSDSNLSGPPNNLVSSVFFLACLQCRRCRIKTKSKKNNDEIKVDNQVIHTYSMTTTTAIMTYTHIAQYTRTREHLL